jgi:hypothetical protein
VGEDGPSVLPGGGIGHADFTRQNV